MLPAPSLAAYTGGTAQSFNVGQGAAAKFLHDKHVKFLHCSRFIIYRIFKLVRRNIFTPICQQQLIDWGDVLCSRERKNIF
jgi:hypothetical protein